MSKTKRVFRNFSYDECDEMARYLEYMALKGWHFKGWKIGMEFEQGNPDEVHYDVQVFSKGEKYDKRPSEDALDYSEYCQEAGWKLIDARGKFCVFQKMREDAIEIILPEEKLANIKIHFMGELGQQILYSLILVGIGTDGILNFKEMIFDTSQVIVFGIGIYFLLYLTLKWVFFMKRMRGHKREIELGITPFYGKENRDYSKRFTWSRLILDGIWWILAIICIVFRSSYIESVVMIIMFIIAGLISLFLSVVRANRKIVVGSSLTFAFIIILIISSITDDDYVKVAKKDSENVQAQMPLVLKDLGVDGYRLKEYGKEENSSLFGTSYHYDLSYNKDAHMNYFVYCSPYNWIMNKIWKETKDLNDQMEFMDVTKQWGAKKAYYDGDGYYVVQYPGKQLEFSYSGEMLTEKQIKVIREKLDL